MIITVLFYTFVVTAVVQLCYYISFTSFLFHKNSNKSFDDFVPVSVIVYAKNNAKHLNRLIPLLEEQEYENYELIFINNASNDETFEVIKEFQANNSRIKIVNVKNNEAFWGNRKYALTLGIKSAKHEQLLFIDADCIPNSKKWIKEMSVHFSESKSIVLGYAAYESKKYSFLNFLIRFDKLLSTVQSFSYTKLQSSYMVDGKNLAYKKSEFYRVNGFINHIKIDSGHHDLFIRDASTSSNTTIALNPDSFIISKTPLTLKKWFTFKIKQLKIFSHYKYKHKFFLGLFSSSKLLFIFLIPFILYYKADVYTLGIILSYLTFSSFIIGFSAKKIQENSILYFLPFIELFLVLFQFVIFISYSISKNTYWK
jgi:glycosyltransferase involved in cell wall biosynthesis